MVIFANKLDFALKAILLGLSLAMIFEAFHVYGLFRIERALEKPEAIAIEEDTPVELIFAKARYLSQQGDFQAALQLYQRMSQKAGSKYFESAKYNMGHIYLTEAARLWNQQGVYAYSQVLTWSRLAQRAFREVLAVNPSNWDARFNLEYALRIALPPREVEKANWTGHKSSVHAIYPGIPGGGP